MHNNEKVKIQLPSGFNVDMSIDSHDNYFRYFSESQFFSFSNFINAGLYFPQIMQFIVVITAILNGKTQWYDILFINLLSGIFFTLVWFIGKFYRIPALSFLSCLLGGNIFRLFLHFIIIAVIAFFVVHDWKVFLFCIIGGAVTLIVKTTLFARLSNYKYHDEIIQYVASFNLKQ